MIEWRPVKGYESYYFVSRCGEIHSVRNEITMKQSIVKGYKQIKLTVHGKYKHLKVHRIVATAFIQNRNSKKYINHKDGNKTNNHASNLEWCTAKENTQHAIKNDLRGYTNKKVYRIDLKTRSVIDGFDSVINASKQLGIPKSSIASCARGEMRQAGGFLWNY